mmetsp:Transcript_69483/g.148643  ORF Transcript_69483/g.148643 Transcript_69483/m.148643 type:complete len:617 (+) Transcript_69483:80-1930(+)
MPSYWHGTTPADVQAIIDSASLHRKFTYENWGYDTLDFKIDGPLATVRIQDVRNANGLTSKLTFGLQDLALALFEHKEVKVVVFTAAGAYFCTGGAFASTEGAGQFVRPMPPGLDEMGKGIEGNKPTAEAFFLLNHIPQVKIASIRGTNMGAGNSLICSMDYVVGPVTKNCQCSFLEAKRGLASCMSWQGIVTKIGVQMTRRVAMMSDDVQMDFAKELGIVSETIQMSSADASHKAADALAMDKALELLKLSEEDLKKHKTTGVNGSTERQFEFPEPIASQVAQKGTDLDFLAFTEEVIDECGRKGRPSHARLSEEMWPHMDVKLKLCGQHVAKITLTNSQGGNALTRAMIEGLLDAVIEVHRSVGKVRLLCIHAEGDYFCSGLHESIKPEDTQLQQLLYLLNMVPVYSIGIVEGKVAGMGISLCACFDALAAKSSVEFDFAGAPIKNGGQYVYCRSSRLSEEKLTELVGKKMVIPASEARDLFLASKVFEASQEVPAIIEHLGECVSKTAPNAVAQCKAYLHHMGGNTCPIDRDEIRFMCKHVARRNMDPEFQDCINALLIPGYKPTFNRYDYNACVAPSAMKRPEDSSEMKALPPPAKSKGKTKAAALPASTMI